MIDIEPCPYCRFDSTALVIKSQEVEHYRKVSYAYVHCGNCQARGPVEHELENRIYQELAIMAWNDVRSVHQNKEVTKCH